MSFSSSALKASLSIVVAGGVTSGALVMHKQAKSIKRSRDSIEREVESAITASE